ncbi:MAG TPA: hypothetical protein ENJ15_06225 [Caldithrix abyssi]|uniref:Uncharacterized protein n=1 Tax=Caldithrix abyssi TaxID=187145 RepID=A0A7V5RQ13_CALAY|nr:hypothetical protein [Caldithrix abyssi]
MPINKDNAAEWHERFLLGRLDGQALKEYERYLKENPSAREEQRQWAEIIATVEESAASAMKEEIRQQVERIKHHNSPYITWYRAAAILFFIVLLPALFYYNDFSPRPAYAPAPRMAIEEAEPENGPAEQPPFPTDDKNVRKEPDAEAARLQQPVRRKRPPTPPLTRKNTGEIRSGENAPRLSPPPAAGKSAVYGSGTKPITESIREQVASSLGQASQPSPSAPKQKPGRVAEDVRSFTTLPENSRGSGQGGALSILNVESAPPNGTGLNDDQPHPPSLPMVQKSIMITATSGAMYHVFSRDDANIAAGTDSIKCLINKIGNVTALILISPPKAMAGRLKEMIIDDSDKNYLVLIFPDKTRYRLKRGLKSAPAIKMP